MDIPISSTACEMTGTNARHAAYYYWFWFAQRAVDDSF